MGGWQPAPTPEEDPCPPEDATTPGWDAVVTRALTGDQSLEAWVRGPGPDGAAVAQRDVRVPFLARDGDPVRAYRLVGAGPRRLEIGGSTAPGGGGLFEHLTVSYDACVPEQP